MKQLNQKGFSAVEGLLVLIIVGLVGFTGWFVWHSQQTASKTPDDSNKSSNVEMRKSTKTTSFESKETCMPKEGLCASAPRGYSLEVSTIPEGEGGLYPGLERMNILDSAGKLVGSIDVSFPQIGGGCDPGLEKTQYLVESFKTNATLDIGDSNQQDISLNIYAVKHILQMSNDSKVSYYPAVSLTNQKRYYQSNFVTCPNTVYVGYAHSARTKSPEGYAASLYAFVRGQAFDSKNDASVALGSADLSAVYSIFKSVRYQ